MDNIICDLQRVLLIGLGATQLTYIKPLDLIGVYDPDENTGVSESLCSHPAET